LKTATGVLLWPPSVFWGATIYELNAAISGYTESKGLKKEEPMTRAEFLRLKEQYK
jgi:hypothetical protein